MQQRSEPEWQIERAAECAVHSWWAQELAVVGIVVEEWADGNGQEWRVETSVGIVERTVAAALVSSLACDSM